MWICWDLVEQQTGCKTCHLHIYFTTGVKHFVEATGLRCTTLWIWGSNSFSIRWIYCRSICSERSWNSWYLKHVKQDSITGGSHSNSSFQAFPEKYQLVSVVRLWHKDLQHLMRMWICVQILFQGHSEIPLLLFSPTGFLTLFTVLSKWRTTYSKQLDWNLANMMNTSHFY